MEPEAFAQGRWFKEGWAVIKAPTQNLSIHRSRVEGEEEVESSCDNVSASLTRARDDPISRHSAELAIPSRALKLSSGSVDP